MSMSKRRGISRRTTTFTWKIICKSGDLVFGCHTDFLLTVVIAKREKARWSLILPSSTLRVQLLYPNGHRVSKVDIKAALHALENQAVESAIFARLAAATCVPPAARSARTERTGATQHMGAGN